MISIQCCIECLISKCRCISMKYIEYFILENFKIKPISSRRFRDIFTMKVDLTLPVERILRFIHTRYDSLKNVSVKLKFFSA